MFYLRFRIVKLKSYAQLMKEIELFLKPELKTEFLYIMNHVKEYHYSFSIGFVYCLFFNYFASCLIYS